MLEVLEEKDSFVDFSYSDDRVCFWVMERMGGLGGGGVLIYSYAEGR